MNDPDSQIDRMLRQSPPDPQPRPGLESRICRTVRQPPTQRISPVVPVIVGIAVAAPMLMLGVFALLPAPPDKPNPVVRHATPAKTIKTEQKRELNPLRGEAIAIRNDASRAGRFLLDALPSLADR